MDSKYEKVNKKWDEIFSRQIPKIPESPLTGNKTFDSAIKWACNGAERIVDFGCGNGTVLFLCALNGSKFHIGIDLSEKGIEVAKKRSYDMAVGEYKFIQGGIEELKNIESSCIDSVVLSNIIDNLYPEDSELLIKEVKRILKVNGKVLVKLNPYITEDKIKEFNIEVVKDSLLDDGLLLLNRSTEEWYEFFNNEFTIKEFKEIYYKEHDQYNRLFYLKKE
ncbi:class I SAM-dependent methyltransferase [Clostridium sp. NSJ-145]|uniref:class I SAM-dependent methyltransferase n=1 Tax=Clostridium sp. NSJ-145 TaxID=2897777 RepID=UPI001E52D293|nr:class I SAM-dependent methyltransferase [Clostridium sp. NSJ-145]MCD2501216.1 class I SAM-dependent methyltransferase [Clostridium sp. NSJ-145]